MCDEGSGAVIADQGKIGGLGMSLTDAVNMWTTMDLGALGGVGAAIACGAGDTARSGTGLSITSGICLVAIMASDNATNPSARETVAAAGASASASYYAQMAAATTADGYLWVRAGTPAGVNARSRAVDVWDGAPHFVAIKVVEAGSSISMSPSSDGAAWAGTSSIAATDFTPDFDRLAIGKQAFLTDNTDVFTGKVSALFVYLNNEANWTDAWLAELFADPWQFLSPVSATKNLKALVHPDAAGVAGVSGIVLNEDMDQVIGEFAGQAFEAALESGQAVLLIPIDTFTTQDLPTATPLQVLVRDATDGTDLFAATVV
jgi:hypothetical protein